MIAILLLGVLRQALLPLCCATEVQIEATIDTDKVVATVSESFHGVAFDASLFTPKGLYSFVNITSTKLINLLKGLSPGYFRVGGTFANWLFFDMKEGETGRWEDWPFKNATPEVKNKTKGWLFRPPNNLTNVTFDTLVQLTKKSNMRLLFDLNDEVRLHGEWVPDQAIKLFDYCVHKGYGDNIDWELGNEPNHISAHNLTEQQVGEDFKKLQEILQKPKYANISKGALVGPDVGWMGVTYIRGLANVSGEKMSAFTIHHYYFDGKTSTVEEYMNASYFENLQKLFDRVKNIMEGSKYADKPVWIGETSSGYNSGTEGVSDTYVSGFLYLDKLGLSALNKVQVAVRQTIYNGYYGLLNRTTLDPNPDYWLMNVHNNLVGRKVFKVSLNNNLKNTVRVYAQCTKTENNSNLNENYKKGALTVFALNVGDKPVKINIVSPSNTVTYGNKEIHAYVMTPEYNITSRNVLLNNNLLKLDASDQLPKLSARRQSIVMLEEKTFGFFVIPDAEVEACKKKD